MTKVVGKQAHLAVANVSLNYTGGTLHYMAANIGGRTEQAGNLHEKAQHASELDLLLR